MLFVPSMKVRFEPKRRRQVVPTFLPVEPSSELHAMQPSVSESVLPIASKNFPTCGAAAAGNKPTRRAVQPSNTMQRCFMQTFVK